MEQLQQPHTPVASTPVDPNPGEDLPPLGNFSSDPEEDFRKRRANDEGSERDTSLDDVTEHKTAAQIIGKRITKRVIERIKPFRSYPSKLKKVSKRNQGQSRQG